MADDSKAAPEKEGETKDDVQKPTKKEEEEDNDQAATTTAEAIEIRSPSFKKMKDVSINFLWNLERICQ